MNPDRAEVREVLELVAREAAAYLEGLDDRRVRSPGMEAAVRSLHPDLAAVQRLGRRGVIVTSTASGDYDFVSRFFAPALGLPEDPVTGSAHCALGPYWGAKLGKPELLAWQASPRGGSLRVILNGERLLLGGHAVTTLRGELVP